MLNGYSVLLRNYEVIFRDIAYFACEGSLISYGLKFFEYVLIEELGTAAYLLIY